MSFREFQLSKISQIYPEPLNSILSVPKLYINEKMGQMDRCVDKKTLKKVFPKSMKR